MKKKIKSGLIFGANGTVHLMGVKPKNIVVVNPDKNGEYIVNYETTTKSSLQLKVKKEK